MQCYRLLGGLSAQIVGAVQTAYDVYNAHKQHISECCSNMERQHMAPVFQNSLWQYYLLNCLCTSRSEAGLLTYAVMLISDVHKYFKAYKVHACLLRSS